MTNRGMGMLLVLCNDVGVHRVGVKSSLEYDLFIKVRVIFKFAYPGGVKM